MSPNWPTVDLNSHTLSATFGLNANSRCNSMILFKKLALGISYPLTQVTRWTKVTKVGPAQPLNILKGWFQDQKPFSWDQKLFPKTENCFLGPKIYFLDI